MIPGDLVYFPMSLNKLPAILSMHEPSNFSQLFLPLNHFFQPTMGRGGEDSHFSADIVQLYEDDWYA